MIGHRRNSATPAGARAYRTSARRVAVLAATAGCTITLACGTNQAAGSDAGASAVPTVHGCPRPISYDHGSFAGGIYDFGHMACRRARTVAKEELEGDHASGFRCGEVKPNTVEPEGAESCRSGHQFVVFASE
jgi:hypothetical protein